MFFLNFLVQTLNIYSSKYCPSRYASHLSVQVKTEYATTASFYIQNCRCTSTSLFCYFCLMKTVVYNPNATAKEFVIEFRPTRDFKQAVSILANNEKLKQEVFELIHEKEYPFPEYSSWLVSYYFMANKKDFTVKWCDFVIVELMSTENHTVHRNLCTALNHYRGDLSERTDFLDKLFDFLSATDSLPALRVNALRNIERHYLKKYPELISELFSVMELLEEQTLPSMKAMVRNFYKKYRK